MNKFIFDIDGTLTPSRQGMNAEFQRFFLEFCYDNHVYLVTGSDHSKTIEQVGKTICTSVNRVYNCNGNDVWEGDVNIFTNEWKLLGKPHEWLSEQLSLSDFPVRTGNHFEHRPGMVNFSIVGRNADKAQRAHYVKWDKERDERKNIASLFNSIFPELEAQVGGETGLDISLKGNNKSQIIKDFSDEDILYFFGDAMQEGGNDYPLAQNVNYPMHVNGWQQTEDLLIQLQRERVAQ